MGLTAGLDVSEKKEILRYSRESKRISSVSNPHSSPYAEGLTTFSDVHVNVQRDKFLLIKPT